MTENEQQLLNAISEGDLQAFESLYRCHKDSLLTVTVVAIGLDRQSAEDILHDVFMHLLAQCGRIAPTTSLRSYLVSCCLNRGRDLLRRRRIDRRAVEKYEPSLTDGSQPSAEMEKWESQQAAIRLLQQLPEDQREVVTMRLHAEMTFPAIAESLNIPVDTAKSRYRYAIQKLRESVPTLDPKGG